MHKKPLVAVLVLGLLVLASSVSMAKEGPYNLPFSGTELPRIARGLVKDAPTGPTSLTGPTTNLEAGISRTGATFCDGEWQGGATYFIGSWFFGDEFYATFQDPGTLTPCPAPDVYTFDVTEILWFVFLQTGPVDVEMQPLVFDNGGDALCPIPGGVLCAGPLYLVSFPGPGAYLLTLPFPDECCVYGPYLAGVYVPTVLGFGVMEVVVDDGATVPPTPCYTWNDYGIGWLDLVVDVGFTWNLELWSAGMAWDQNGCPGVPGICDWVAWYGAITYFWTDPDGNLATDRYTRFNPDVECTLMASAHAIYAGGSVGTPTARFRVYGNSGPIFGARMYPGDDAIGPEDPANFIASVDVPWASLSLFPAFHVVDWTTYPGWPTGFVYTTGENYFITMSLSPLTPDPVGDVLAVLSDDGVGPGTDRSGAYYLGAIYLYNDEAFGTGYAWIQEAYECCEIVPVVEINCDAKAGPDDWNTYAHDWERTSATDVNLGDPCEVRAVWSRDLPELNSFNGPTIFDNRVYVSSDQTLQTYDLDTGAPGNTVSGLPYMFASNRGNMTSVPGATYITGGNAQAISRWANDLTPPEVWVNGIGAGAGPLLDQCRFGVTAVYDIAGTEVVVVGTEAGGAGQGYLWCFETAGGAVYAGWPTNPLVFPNEGILHAPAFDGTDLYVGTADPSLTTGQIYRIDASTGAIVWTYTPTNVGDGFPNGVSLDGEYIYAASGNSSLTGSRMKLDKTGALQWEFAQSRALYGTPTIGRAFVYMVQDVGGAGVLIVDKAGGAALYNYAADGVGAVTQHATLMCDNYIFVGDRAGHWWLLDVNNQTALWDISFPGIVNQTAVGTGTLGEYAVVSIRSGNATNGGGSVAAFKFNAGPRPRAQQNVSSTTINVPFGTGAGNLYTEVGVLGNVGCADLDVTAINITDPPPDVVAKSYENAQSQYAAAMANVTVGADYTAYFENSTKLEKMGNFAVRLDTDELTKGDIAMESATKAMAESKTANNRMAAGAQVVRTSNVTLSVDPIPVGSVADVNWLWDGTGLERGLDDEVIEMVTDDPDALFFGNQPALTIHYIGGCLNDSRFLEFNTLSATSVRRVFNHGALGDDDDNDGLIWGPDGDNDPHYDGSWLLAGDSLVSPDGSPGTGGAQFRADLYGTGNWSNMFPANPRPSDGLCDFDGAEDVLMGYRRDGGCPGTPVPINGEWLRAYFTDTNLVEPAGSPLAAIGVNVTMTEVGAYDPVYGDFTVIRWELENRDGTAKDLHAGTFTDYDVDGGDNRGLAAPSYNGYALWADGGHYAYGMFDPDLQTDHCGVSSAHNAAHRIWTLINPNHVYDGPWANDLDTGAVWFDMVNRTPAYENEAPPDPDDRSGMLVNKAFTLPGGGTAAVHQGFYAVPFADPLDEAAIEAAGLELAQRAAVWAGFSRGNANMDDCVNLTDVCWILSPNQIYPDDYNGDVDGGGGVGDNADAQYLLNYVTGMGPAPVGSWRFTF